MEKTIRNRNTRPSDNFQDRSNDDPRIDSPEIKVTYPAYTKEIPVNDPQDITASDTITTQNEQPTENQPEEKHECKVGLQEAITQNLLPFLGIALGVFVIGFLIGKK